MGQQRSLFIHTGIYAWHQMLVSIKTWLFQLQSDMHVSGNERTCSYKTNLSIINYFLHNLVRGLHLRRLLNISVGDTLSTSMQNLLYFMSYS